MAAPFLAQLELLRALGGEPKVTYPYGDPEYPVTERVQTLPRIKAAPLPFITTSEPDTARFPTCVLVEQIELRGDRSNVEVYRKYERVPGKVQTFKMYDATTDTVVEETRQLVGLDEADVTPSNLFTDYRDVPQGATKMRIQRTYPNSIIGKTIVEYRQERFVYPAILGSLSGAMSGLTKSSGEKVFLLNLVIEAERPRLTPHRLTTTFTTTAPNAAAISSGILDLQPRRHSYNGVLFNVSTGPVLSNAGTITATTGTDDPVWGSGLVETYTFVASVPTATTYLASRAAGNYFGLVRESKKIAQGLYMLTLIEIPYL